jgi:5-formyltetrahydrofolate cyclo-ligase
LPQSGSHRSKRSTATPDDFVITDLQTKPVTTKAELRSTIARARAQLTAQQRGRARDAIRESVLLRSQAAGLAAHARIAAYEPLVTEPGSIELLAQLTHAGFEVIVPITQPDKDLNWVVWSLSRQAGPPLGLTAIGHAELVIVPALAVDHAGHRLGRGGGSYDRALARIRRDVPVVALLFDDEFLDEVPAEEWDLPVSAVVTPTGWTELPS